MYDQAWLHVETAEHIFLFPEEGLIEVFWLTASALERWLDKADTDPDLAGRIVECMCGGGEQLGWMR